MKHRIDVKRCQGRVRLYRKQVDPGLQKLLQRVSDHVEGEEEHCRHDPDETRDRRIAPGQDLVDLKASLPFYALPRLYDRRLAHTADKRIAHIRDRGRPVESPFLLHLSDQMLAGLPLILIELKRLNDTLISLYHLVGCEPDRNIRRFTVVLDQVHDGVNTAVHSAAVIVRFTEILSPRFLLVIGHMHGMADQFINAFIGRCRDRDDRDAKHILHGIDPDTASVSPHLVHHIERQHHRNIQLHQLHCQVHVPLNIGRVGDIDDPLGMFPQNKLSCNQFLAAVGGHGINAGKVRHERVFFPSDHSVLSVHCHAGEVSYVLIGTCQLVEQRGLPAVLVSCQGKGDLRSLRESCG